MKKIMCFMAAGIMTASLLTGCDAAKTSSNSGEAQSSVPTSGKIDTVIITTIRANQPLPNASVIAEAASNTCENGGDLWLVTADGEPDIAAHATYEGISVFGKNERAAQLAELTDEIVQQVGQKCEAAAPESDLVDAINKAASILADSPNNKELVIYDNCIMTEGVLTLQGSGTGLSSIDLNALADDLQENNEITSLDGVAVDIYGIAMTSLPQPELSNTEQMLLQDFMENILTHAGAANVTFHSVTSSQSSAEVDGLPEVSVIPIDGTEDYVGKHLISDPIIFDETAVGFLDNSNQLRDMSAAKQALQEAADTLKEYPQNVYVAATTAYDADLDGCKARAAGRANTIIELLVNEMGVDRSLLHPAALGCGGPFYTEENGSEEIAKSNRSVTIVACESNTGKEIEAFLNE